MQSLSEECTPLKQRYDSCFNLWFEGYLQPALDASSASPRSAIPQGIPDAPSLPTSDSTASPSSIPSPSAPAPITSIPFRIPTPATEVPGIRTSWSRASVFRTRSAAPSHAHCAPAPADDMVSAAHVHHAETEAEPLDTTGMTRAQAKAAQYERQCGRAWREYQGCLRKAIGENQNLTQLLNQAREEHPLHSMDGLEGTPWDPNHKASE